ncbi:hypothetical protein BGX31_005684, partial [Mortierella sp. GBA43]
MVNNQIKETAKDRRYQDETTRAEFLKERLNKTSSSFINRTRLPRNILDYALSAQQGSSSTSSVAQQRKKQLGKPSETLAAWKEVVQTYLPMEWEKELRDWERAITDKAKKATKGKGRAKDYGGGGDDGGDDGGGDDGGEGDDSRVELRTCTSTLKRIMRPDPFQSDGQST